MDARSYAVVLEPEPDGGYSAHIPAFHGAHTQGETVEEALSNARDVIAAYVEVLTERASQPPGFPLPPPIVDRGEPPLYQREPVRERGPFAK
jgi:antitoxin HicB